LRQEFVYGGELAEEVRLVGGKNAAFVRCHGVISTQNARAGEGSKGDGQGGEHAGQGGKMLNTEDTEGGARRARRGLDGVGWPQGHVDGAEGRCCMSRFAGDER
jgi:hypothetical protein